MGVKVNFYSSHEMTKKQFGFVASFNAMKKYEHARKVLPPDTTYVLVAEIIERQIDEPLGEIDVVTTLKVPVGFYSHIDGGMRGRFVGYISIAGDKLRIHTQEGQLVFEEALNRLQTDIVKTKRAIGDYVIQNAAKKFIIGQLAVVDANPDFRSEVTPYTGGIRPLFDLMAEGGATVNSMSKEEQGAYQRQALKLFFIIAGIMAAIPVIILTIMILSSRN
jgi:hypothetical protein